MSDQKLTPEQIAGFEARAAAGERPALEWERRFDGRLILREMHTLMIQHTPEDSDAGGYLSIYGLGVRATRFHSYLAAQLAAEHLLLEATAPLHSVNDPYEIGFWRENADKFEQCAMVLFDASPDETDGWAREDTAAKIKALIEKRDAEVAALRASIERRETDYITLLSEYDVVRTRASNLDLENVHLKGLLLVRDSLIAELEAALGEAREDHARTLWLLRNNVHGGDIHWDIEVEMWKGEVYTHRMSDPIPFGSEDEPWTPEARLIVDSARAAEKGAQGGEGNEG